MKKDEFNKLLALIKTNKSALERICDFYYPRIIMHISLKFNKNIAEDVAQEFFLNLLKAQRFNYVECPTSWIYKSCENLAKKKLINQEIFSEDLLFDNENYICGLFEKNYDVWFADICNKDVVSKMFDLIEDDITKKVFYMYYFEGYNLREISEMLNIKQSTIKQKHARTIKKLKDFLKNVAKNKPI